MSFVITKYPQKPIVLVQIDLANHHTTGFAGIQARLCRLMAEQTPPLVMILDLRNQEIGLCDVRLFLDHCEERPYGTPADPRIHTILFSEHPVIPILRRRLEERFDIPVEHTTRLDDALHRAQRALSAPRKMNDS